MKSKLSVRVDLPKGRLGPGKIAILAAIAECGSIAAAARSMGMSYRRAWTLIASLNEAFVAPVVETRTGGAEKGGARLSACGEEVLALYREMAADMEAGSVGKRRQLESLARR